MNITFNPNNLSSQYKYNNTKQNTKYSQPTFTSVNVPTDSRLLNPVKNVLGGLTDGIAKFYTAKIYTSPIARKMAKKAENWDGVVNGMQIAGSAIISGMYMTKTLTNDKLDEKRKKTLSINQGLTFGLSTGCGMWLDSKLDNQWEKFTQNYASRQLNDENLKNKINIINAEYIEEAEQEYGKKFKDLTKKERPKNITTEKYFSTLLDIKQIKKFEDLETLKTIDLNNFDNNAKQIVEDMKIPEGIQEANGIKLLRKVLKQENINNLEDLVKFKSRQELSSSFGTNLRGMNVLKKIMVFGTVYRFLGPVAVTPIANWIGNNLLHRNNETKKSA
ncbi:MAG: hypothetical protein E7Z87_03940 [Cyanobacteria bacterium SIG26]|nr:hypothetical protein [Cyanobacteria bacterium SIG26]